MADIGYGGIRSNIGRVSVTSATITEKDETILTMTTSFLMLPGTFIKDPRLRTSQTFIGVFSIAILAAGFAFTGLLAFAVRNPLFLADNILQPALISCIVGLLTVPYNFLINARYEWNTPALLTVLAAALSTITYGGLLIWTQRRIKSFPAHTEAQSSVTLPLRAESVQSSGTPLWQDPGYYENYIRNMFPAAASSAVVSPTNDYDPNSITEEEMTRQQMLMLLLQHSNQQSNNSNPNASEGTFRIEWQGQEQDDAAAPSQGYYAPNSATTTPESTYPLTAISRQITNELRNRPWDGVWRSSVPAPPAQTSLTRDRAHSQEDREQRRREIEMGPGSRVAYLRDL